MKLGASKFLRRERRQGAEDRCWNRPFAGLHEPAAGLETLSTRNGAEWDDLSADGVGGVQDAVWAD